MGSQPLLAPSPAVRLRMQRTPQRDNPKELQVRSELHRIGLRFRIHHRPVAEARAEADVAFPAQRIAVMIDGCFWHRCPIHGTSPKRNSGWWDDKLAANVARDVRLGRALDAAGWLVLRFWEHEDVGHIVECVQTAVRDRTISLSQHRRRAGASP